MDFFNFVNDNLLILIPVLYFLGKIISGTEKIKNKYIPVILLPIGILFSVLKSGVNLDSVLQGILITGITVYSNQVIKQLSKKE